MRRLKDVFCFNDCTEQKTTRNIIEIAGAILNNGALSKAFRGDVDVQY